MNTPLRLSRTLPLAHWDDGVRERLMQFWRGRGFTFIEADGDFLQAKRGSLWGNLTAFDSKKLLTTLAIARPSPVEVLCLLEVDTRFQTLVEWNHAYWQLELDTQESFLFRNDLKEAIWHEFERDSRRAFAIWTATGGILGNKLTDRWKTRV